MKRAGEPVDVFYLPFNENWPVDLYQHFTPSYWANEAFDEVYQIKLGKSFKAFANHFTKKEMVGHGISVLFEQQGSLPIKG